MHIIYFLNFNCYRHQFLFLCYRPRCFLFHVSHYDVNENVSAGYFTGVNCNFYKQFPDLLAFFLKLFLSLSVQSCKNGYFFCWTEYDYLTVVGGLMWLCRLWTSLLNVTALTLLPTSAFSVGLLERGKQVHFWDLQALPLIRPQSSPVIIKYKFRISSYFFVIEYFLRHSNVAVNVRNEHYMINVMVQLQ